MILQRKTYDAGHVAGADPFGDVATVLFNRPFGKIDLAADLPGRFLLADESDDLDLTGRKAGIGDDQPGVFLRPAVIIGVVQQTADYRMGTQWTEAVIFVYLILVMVLRPRGLLGEETREAG